MWVKAEGRTVLANEELKSLIGREDVVGQCPSDYWDTPVAQLVMAHDQVVREHNVPILCAELIPAKNTIRERLAIRFPIRDKEGQVEMTGALGFDLPQFQDNPIMKRRENGRRPYRLQPDRSLVFWSNLAESPPDHLLFAFIRELPAITTAKDLQGRLLCVNSEYTKVTGKPAESVIGRRPHNGP
jgi:hypothetical protein